MAEKSIIEIYDEIEIDGLEIEEEKTIEQLKNKKKIMIVDDDTSIAKLTKIIFEMEGYSTIVAYNGKEALTKLKLLKRRYNLLPDLMLLDIKMPILSGDRLCKGLKKEFREDQKISEYLEYTQFPIYFFTGRPEDELKEVQEKTKPDGYILKPFEVKNLISKVNEILNF